MLTSFRLARQGPFVGRRSRGEAGTLIVYREHKRSLTWQMICGALPAQRLLGQGTASRICLASEALIWLGPPVQAQRLLGARPEPER